MDQTFNEGGVTAGPVECLFDGNNFVVLGSFADEAFDRIVKALVGVVNKQISTADG